MERLGVHRPAWESPDGLTLREREVLVLVVDGCSNCRIGEALYISDRTVRSPRRRTPSSFIPVTSRTQAARYAIDRGISTAPPGRRPLRTTALISRPQLVNRADAGNTRRCH